jgi:hyperosmotically inducible protein
MKSMKHRIIILAAALALATPVFAAAQTQDGERQISNPLVGKKVRKALVTLPFYGVFDNLAYKIEGNTVTLYGQVVRPTTSGDAARRVARIVGVSRVINNIEVLPLSSFDDSIRVQTFRAIFRKGGLNRYLMGTNPSIHIIVNRGHVTLEGVVTNEMDKQLAYFAANGVTGVFSVTNNLQTERSLAR